MGRPTITAPGIYAMPLTDYVADPCPTPSLNASAAHALLTSTPKHAWLGHPRLGHAERDGSSRADLGTVAHGLLLENDESRVVVIQADDWRTKAAKELRDEAWAAGKVPILEKDMATVRRMVEAADHVLMGSALCEDWMGAIPEQTLLCEHGGVWLRSRPDKLSRDGRVYFDYKTSASAHPAAFAKAAINQGYDLQAAIGRRAVHALHGVTPTVIFVVQEIEPPFFVSLVSLSNQFLEIADMRLSWAIDKWRHCLTHNHWPGYPDQLVSVDPPGYYGMDQLEQIPEEAA